MKYIFLLFFYLVTLVGLSIPPEYLADYTIGTTSQGNTLLLGKNLNRAIYKKGITLDQLGLLGPQSKEKTRFKPSDALLLLEKEIIPFPVSQLPPTQIDKYKKRALAAKQHVKNKQAYKAQLNGVKFELPIGVRKTVGNAAYTLIIDSIKVTSMYAYVVAYMVVDDPKNNQALYFLGKDIRFSRQGGFTGEARLELMEDYTLKVGNAANITFKADPLQQKETFVIFDCDGFKRLHLDADILFNEQFVPEDKKGNPTKGSIKAEFSTEVEDWNNWIVEIPSLETFQLSGLEGVSFTFNNIAFDKSDYINPQNMRFPEGYFDQEMDIIETWEGFYAGEIVVSLPSNFEKRGTDERITFAAQNMIIDHYGFSGNVSGKNIFTLEQGKLGNWAYSLDYFKLNFVKNNLEEGTFGGDLLLPIAKESHVFNYTSIIVPNKAFNFHIQATDDLEFPLFGASNVTLFPNSSVEVTVENGKFKPEADLSGQMNIGASVNSEEGSNEDASGQGSLNLAQIEFQRLILKTDAPYLSLHPEGGGISFGSDLTRQNMGKFPITILHISLESRMDDDVALEVGIRVNLAKGEDSGFAGEADVAVVGTMRQSKERISWRYKKAELNRILVDVKNGGFSISGEIMFFRNDPMFGNGFGGNVLVTFKPGFEVESAVLFGNKPEVDNNGNNYNMRYWFVDGMLTLPTSMAIPIFTGVAINGFGGGAYYHMTMDPTGQGFPSTSGLSYVPDKKTFLGVRGSIKICGYPSASICKGEVNLEISFLEGGGLGKVAFYGMATIMSFNVPGVEGLAEEIKNKAGTMAEEGKDKASIIPTSPEGSSAMKQKLNEKADGAIGASWLIIWDNENNSLHSDLEVLVNVAGVLRGVKDGSADNVAGQMVMHFEPDYWYIHAGTPSSMNAINALGLVTLESYFMMGHEIEAFPALPHGVEGVITDMPSSMLENGVGVAFGSRVTIGPANKKFLIFYAKFSAGFGFDIMVVKMNPPVYCKGSSSPAGVNNWLAIGRAYAYFTGTMGLEAKVFGKKRKLEIGYLSASISMGAKLPNPSYAVGAMSLRYRLLGGLVKGNSNFRLSLGRECKYTNLSETASVKIISELHPANFQKDYNVFGRPMAALNMPLEEEFEVIDNNGKSKYYRAVVQEVSLWNDGLKIPGEHYLNDKKDEIYFKSDAVLPEFRKLTFKVKLRFEKKSGCCDWVPLGDEDMEEQQTTFTTGEEPGNISNENIFYSYPMVNMKNLYKDQYGTAYIKMNTLQKKAISLDPGFKFEIRYYQGKDELIYTDDNLKIMNKASAKRHLEFHLPTALFQTSSSYTLEIVKTPVQQKEVGKVVTSYNDMNGVSTLSTKEVQVRNRSISEEVKVVPDEVIVKFEFRTSRYPLWIDKFNTFTTNGSQLAYSLNSSSHNLQLGLTLSNELWEYSEVDATSMDDIVLPPFVRGIATNYNSKAVEDKHYGDYLRQKIYTSENMSKLSREVNYNNPVPTEANLLKRVSRGGYAINFKTSEIIFADYLEIRQKAINAITNRVYNNSYFQVSVYTNRYNKKVVKYVRGSSEEDVIAEMGKYASNLIEEKYEPMPNGVYQVDIGYYLPGETRAIHSQQVNFDFEDRDKLVHSISQKVDKSIAQERKKRKEFLSLRGLLYKVPEKTKLTFLWNMSALIRNTYYKNLEEYNSHPWWRK